MQEWIAPGQRPAVGQQASGIPSWAVVSAGIQRDPGMQETSCLDPLSNSTDDRLEARWKKVRATRLPSNGGKAWDINTSAIVLVFLLLWELKMIRFSFLSWEKGFLPYCRQKWVHEILDKCVVAWKYLSCSCYIVLVLYRRTRKQRLEVFCNY